MLLKIIYVVLSLLKFNAVITHVTSLLNIILYPKESQYAVLNYPSLSGVMPKPRHIFQRFFLCCGFGLFVGGGVKSFAM